VRTLHDPLHVVDWREGVVVLRASMVLRALVSSTQMGLTAAGDQLPGRLLMLISVTLVYLVVLSVLYLRIFRALEVSSARYE